MDIFTNKKIIQKIAIILIIAIILTFSIPPFVYASEDDDWGFGGDILEQLIKLIDSVGDIVMGLLNKSFLGTSKIIGSVMLDQDDHNVTSSQGIWYYNENAEIKKVVENLDGFIWRKFKVPNILYCPENIFANNIAALDVNFLSPNDYKAVQTDGTGNATSSAEKASQSAAEKFQEIISSWYNTFKNIAIVALLTILVYIGIRIVLGSTSAEKAKYKERLYDWIVALCLVFVMHFIMSGIQMLTNSVTDIFGAEVNQGIAVTVVNKGNVVARFNTNYMGYIRLLAQSDNAGVCAAYSIMYVALVIFTVMFTFTYLKRFLYMAFFTMIAPLVAITYPLDKLGDSKAQAFTMWLREYTMNAIIQPVHLILYSVFVTSAMELATENPIYACATLGFLLPAEKFIKSMFGFDKATSTGTLGAIAGGSIAMNAVKSLVSGSAKSKGGSSSSNNEENGNIKLSRGKNDNYSSDPLDALAGGMQGGNQGANAQNMQQQNSNFANFMQQSGATTPNFMQQSSTTTPNFMQQSGTTTPSGIFIPASAQQTQGRTSNASRVATANTPSTPSVPSQAITPSRFTRFKNSKPIRGIAAVASQKANAIAGKFTKNNAKKAIKGVAKTGVKLGAAALGAAALGVVAAGAGITTGDLESGVAMAGGGALLGAKLGSDLGGNIAEKAGGSIKNTIDEYNRATKDPTEAEIARQKEFDKNWKNQKENIDYLTQKRKMTHQQAKDFLNETDTQRFLDAGITDINMIYNARNLKDSNGNKYSTDRAIATAEMAKKVHEDFSTNYQEQEAFKNNMKQQNSRITDDDTVRIVNDINKVNKQP